MAARLSTRLTEKFSLDHPILSAPMALAAGGRLAAAVTEAGGLGLIGGGYGDAAFVEDQFRAAGNAAVGCGFITWSIADRPEILEAALGHRPRALMLSFGDPTAFAPVIAAAGVPLICQCQNLDHVRQACAAGAAIIIAQGAEAGGHGSARGTLSFVPEVIDIVSRTDPDTLVLAAGGIADGRGLAAALSLGADGVLVGTRFWAASEALVHQNHRAAMLSSDGDTTVRTSIPDIARRLPWPAGFTIRVMDNAYIRRWSGREAELAAAITSEGPSYAKAFAGGDVDNAAVVFGEGAGLIHAIEPAATIIARMVAEAVTALRRGGASVRET